MSGEVFRRHGMLHLDPPPCTNAIVWSVIGTEVKYEAIKAPTLEPYASFSFHTTNTITIHMNSDKNVTRAKTFGMYLEKLLLLEKILLQVKEHLDKEDPEPLSIKEFLSGEDEPTFGSAIQIYISNKSDDWLEDPCIFDISDCFKKHRSSMNRETLNSLLTKLITELRAHMEALSELYDLYKESIK